MPRKPRGRPGHYWHHPYWYCDDYYYDWDDYHWDWDDYHPDWDDYYSDYRQPHSSKSARNYQYLKVSPMLMMSLLEYARSEAQSDVETQAILDRMINLSMRGGILDVDSYESIVGKSEYMSPPAPVVKPMPVQTPPKTTE